MLAHLPIKKRGDFSNERAGYAFQDEVNDGAKQEQEFCSLLRVLTTVKLSEFGGVG